MRGSILEKTKFKVHQHITSDYISEQLLYEIMSIHLLTLNLLQFAVLFHQSPELNITNTV